MIARLSIRGIAAGAGALLAAAAMLLAPAQSHAYSRIGSKWSGGKITY